MSLEVKVNLSDEMNHQVGYYAEMIGVSTSALCSVLIGERILDFNSKQQHKAPESLPTVREEPHLFAIEKRLYQLFAGWVAQFENMPDYQLNIKVNDGKVYVDEQYLCEVEERIEGCEIDVDFIALYITRENTDIKLFLNIEWQDGQKPFVREVEVEI